VTRQAPLPSFRGGTAAISKELTGVAGTAGDRAGKETGRRFDGSMIAATKGFVRPSAALFAIDKISGFCTSAVSGASDLSEAGNKIREVFGARLGQIQAFAGQGATELGQSKLVVLEAAATFGVLEKVAGLAGAENAKFSKQLVRLSTDLASFYNTSPEDAVVALGAALRASSNRSGSTASPRSAAPRLGEARG
jgi:hypothetical protein